jgi:hypothetical protein
VEQKVLFYSFCGDLSMAQPGKVIISFIGSPNIRLRDNVAVALGLKSSKLLAN